MSGDSVEIRNKSILRKRKRVIQIKQSKCKHKKTVALNEEGYTGVYCVDCGEQLAKEC